MKTRKKLIQSYYTEKKSLFSIDGSVSLVVLVQLVKKWPDLFEIRQDFIEIWLDFVKIKQDLIEIRLDLNISSSIWYRSDGFQQILAKFCNFQPLSRTDRSEGRSDHPNRPFSPVSGESRNGRFEVIGSVLGWAQTQPKPTRGQALYMQPYYS